MKECLLYVKKVEPINRVSQNDHVKFWISVIISDIRMIVYLKTSNFNINSVLQKWVTSSWVLHKRKLTVQYITCRFGLRKFKRHNWRKKINTRVFSRKMLSTRYRPIGTYMSDCRDPIFSNSRDMMIICFDSRDAIFNSRNPNRFPESP